MAPAPFFDASHAGPVEELLQKGLSYRQIAAEYGCDHTTVSKFVAQYLPAWHERRSDARTRPAGMRLLVIDIETRPNLAYIWDIWQRYTPPERILDEKEVISFAAKWVGATAVEFRSVHHDGRPKMIERAHALLTEADGVITYNGDQFDLQHLNLEFLRNGLAPPAPYKSIDLLKVIKRRFKFTSRKLQHVAAKLGIGSKVEHEGFSLWTKCMAGDSAAWAKMREYNIGDVQLTEDLYTWLLPWIDQHPSFAAFTSSDVCVNCGSAELRQSGYYHTKTGTYARYQCASCGKWQRAVRRSFHTEITETAV